MNTADLCAKLAHAINKVENNEMDCQKAQTLLGLANSMTRARRLQMDYNQRKTTATKAVDGLD